MKESYFEQLFMTISVDVLQCQDSYFHAEMYTRIMQLIAI